MMTKWTIIDRGANQVVMGEREVPAPCCGF